MNTYRNDRVCDIEQDAVILINTTEIDPGPSSESIPARLISVTNTNDATNADGHCKCSNYAELDHC